MKDEIVYKERFAFDKKVASCFGDMLKRSVPEYETMRELVELVGERYISSGKPVVDVGCSWGDAVAPFISAHDDNQFYLYDVSQSMLDVCKDRFADTENVIVEARDVRKGTGVSDACLILSVLTVQFTPIEQRHEILRKFYESLKEGGALIYVEKVLGDTAGLNDVLVDGYYETKEKRGYSREQIDTKRTSLEGVLVPVTARWNEELLYKSGFREVECFWRALNFAAWVAVK